MADRGRKSAASLVVASPTTFSQRLAPPPYLTPAQKAVWVLFVNSKPADWFDESHGPMLAQLCRHTVTSDLIAQQQENFDPAWLTDDDGLKRFNLLAAAMERESRTMNALLRSMRLTQQSLIRAEKVVHNQGKGRKPWQLEND
jgi:hypothetical protein